MCVLRGKHIGDSANTQQVFIRKIPVPRGAIAPESRFSSKDRPLPARPFSLKSLRRRRLREMDVVEGFRESNANGSRPYTLADVPNPPLNRRRGVIARERRAGRRPLVRTASSVGSHPGAQPRSGLRRTRTYSASSSPGTTSAVRRSGCRAPREGHAAQALASSPDTGGQPSRRWYRDRSARRVKVRLGPDRRRRPFPFPATKYRWAERRFRGSISPHTGPMPPCARERAGPLRVRMRARGPTREGGAGARFRPLQGRLPPHRAPLAWIRVSPYVFGHELTLIAFLRSNGLPRGAGGASLPAFACAVSHGPAPRSRPSFRGRRSPFPPGQVIGEFSGATLPAVPGRGIAPHALISQS